MDGFLVALVEVALLPLLERSNALIGVADALFSLVALPPRIERVLLEGFELRVFLVRDGLLEGVTLEVPFRCDRLLLFPRDSALS